MMTPYLADDKDEVSSALRPPLARNHRSTGLCHSVRSYKLASDKSNDHAKQALARLIGGSWLKLNAK
jgi:hypothetical protein